MGYKIKPYQGIDHVTDDMLRRVIHEEKLSDDDFKILLSKEAKGHLEAMAIRVQEEHQNFFGSVVTLYTPLYVSNYCVNKCLYCSYHMDNKIQRHQLSLEAIENEAKLIAETGLRHILLLTGESEHHTPLSYIEGAVQILKKYFESVSIEIYPLDRVSYERLVQLGVDGLTIYQETYNPLVYSKVHPSGPKSDFDYRLETPERGARAGMYHITIGALLGLNTWEEEVYNIGHHIKYLEDHYPNVQLSISIPRIRPFSGQKFENYIIDDHDLVQMILALKLFLPHVGINLSTRESAELRENLLPLGISRMSAGVRTTVGGHDGQSVGDAQFEIADNRSVNEMVVMLENKGYQAVLKDWVGL